MRPRKQDQGGHRTGRNYLAGRHGDAAKAVLAAIGYNFRLLLIWFSVLSRFLLVFVIAGQRSPDHAPCYA